MKKITAIIFLAVLFLTINIANANPIYFYYLPTQAVKTPPDIHIQSPIQGGTQSSNITWLNFTVTKPASWFNNQSEDEYVPINGYSNNMPVVYFNVVKVQSWHYELDGIGGQSYPVEDLNGDSLVPEETFNFSNALTLDEGIHNITVIVQSKSYYRDLGSRIGPQMDAQTHTTDIVGNSETVNFTVDLLAPTVSINQTFENSTFRTSNVTIALVFNKPVSQIIYCLDNQSNATADGNLTLSISNLSNGEHSLTVYAKDNYGVISKPSMISFSVKVPEPFPTPTIIAIIIVITTIVGANVGLLNYRKRTIWSRKFDYI